LAALLQRHGYQITRQTGSHMRLTSPVKGTEHNITIPRHKSIRVGTLSSIVKEVASYLEIDWQQLAADLFS
jgi:predicted RNA binding protein YcfA (HicA-like mRNA interferase family)